jgi:ABC-type glycerol-3-phosphate transport system permease component
LKPGSVEPSWNEVLFAFVFITKDEYKTLPSECSR